VDEIAGIDCSALSAENRFGFRSAERTSLRSSGGQRPARPPGRAPLRLRPPKISAVACPPSPRRQKLPTIKPDPSPSRPDGLQRSSTFTVATDPQLGSKADGRDSRPR
jgi:hypothetical protein